jgi:hypothetical protein
MFKYLDWLKFAAPQYAKSDTDKYLLKAYFVAARYAQEQEE